MEVETVVCCLLMTVFVVAILLTERLIFKKDVLSSMQSQSLLRCRLTNCGNAQETLSAFQEEPNAFHIARPIF